MYRFKIFKTLLKSEYLPHTIIFFLSLGLSVGNVQWWITIMIIFELSYYILKSTYDNQQIYQNKLYLRKEALKKAKIFLSPYHDIWSNLRLSNKYCYLKLGAVPDDIVGGEKLGLKRKFRVIASEVYTFEDLWNMFCKYFNALVYIGRVHSI